MSQTTDTFDHVIRSGCWGNTNPAVVRAAYNRNSNTPSDRRHYAGFRCALRGREPVVKP